MNKYSHYSVRCKGKRNGRNFRWKFWPFLKITKEPVPKPDDVVVPQFESELFEAVESGIHEISKQWKETDEKLKPKYCIAVTEQKDALKAFEKETEEANSATTVFESIRKELHELTPPSISPFWMIFWLVFIGLAEFPLNSIAFQIFGASMAGTIIMTASIMFIFPFAAHLFGKSLKQDHHTIKDILLIIVIPLVIFGLIGAISIFREKLFEEMKSHSFLKIDMSPQTAMILFILINIAIFFIASLIAYEGTYPNNDLFRTIYKRYKSALKSLRKESTEAKAAEWRLIAADRSLVKKRNERAKALERLYEQAKILKNNYEWLVRSYRDANMSVRDNAIIPACFKTEPKEVILPDILDPMKLDWECELQKQNTGYERKIILN